MTDYGRGSGSEPWHPEDPLYGDQGWEAQQAGDGPAAQDGGPRQQYGQQGQPQEQYGQQGEPQGQYGQQGEPQGQYGAGHDPYQQQYPQQGYGEQQYQQYPGGQFPQQGYPEQQQYAQQYQQQPAQPGRQYDGGQGYDPSYGQQIPQQQHPQQGYAQGPQGGGYAGQGHDPYQQGQQQPQQPQYDPQYGGGWDTGAQQQVGYLQQPGQYGGPQPGDYDQGQGAPQGGNPAGPGSGVPGDGYGNAYPDPDPDPDPGQHPPQAYGAPAGGQTYPPQAAQEAPAARQEPESSEWDEEQPEETHPFFTGKDTPLPGRDRAGRGGSGLSDDDDDDDYDESGDASGGAGKKRKGRSGAACLVVAVVLIGGVGGLGYFGYTFYQHRFGPPPDYAGSGTVTVQVTVPDGANGSEIAALLVKSGVVKSPAAFVAAQNGNPKGNAIQAGVYTLKKQMSGESAVALMLSPNSRNALIIPEGTRDAAIYALIDKQLKLKAGTTRSVAFAQTKNLGLPGWADDGKDIRDPLEGFLFPASYPVAKNSKPEDVLKQMVARANAEYDKYGLETKAKSVGLDNPWQLLTVASLVQAEGKTHDDFRKIAEVVYNRLKPSNEETHQLLQFDSTYNYLKGQSHINISEAEVNGNHNPYNTYTQKGLPPGPIGNPGEDALEGALHPTHDGWLYFVATDGDNKTEFAKTDAEFQQLKQKFNDKQEGLGG